MQFPVSSEIGRTVRGSRDLDLYGFFMHFSRNPMGSVSTAKAFVQRSARAVDRIWYRGIDFYNQVANEI